MNIFLTFSLSVITVFAADKLKKHPGIKNSVLMLIILCLIFIITKIIPLFVSGLSIEYGFFGVLLPLLCFYGRSKKEKMILFTFGLTLIILDFGNIQIFSLLSLPFIATYNGKRGKYPLKWFFYIYYPVHLVLIYALKLYYELMHLWLQILRIYKIYKYNIEI